MSEQLGNPVPLRRRSNTLAIAATQCIVVGQDIISAAQDAREEADHETLTALHIMNVRQLQILEQQRTILEMPQQKSG